MMEVTHAPSSAPEMAELEARLELLGETITRARTLASAMTQSDAERERLDDQARRAGDAARYFLMGP